MKTLRLLFGLALIAITLEQCAKGDPGAPGATGPTGLTGSTGATGPTGANNNGAYSTFTSNPVDWSTTNASGYNFGIAAYTDDSLTAYNVANGVVAVYVQAGSSWVPLPFTYPYSSSINATQTMTFNYAVNTLTLQTQNSDNSTTNLIPPSAITVKAVIIPVLIMKQHPGLNTRDYASVMQALNKSSNK